MFCVLYVLMHKTICCEITVSVNHYNPNLELIYKIVSAYRLVLLLFWTPNSVTLRVAKLEPVLPIA